MFLLKRREGMILIEVMVAVLILGIAIIPLVSFFVTGSILTTAARNEVTALNFAQDLVEQVKSVASRQVNAARENTGGGSNKIRLAVDAARVNADDLVTITSGKGEGQVRKISAFNDTTKIATVNLPWDSGKEPDQTSHYLLGSNGAFLTGAVQGGGSSTIKLAAGENNKDDFYKGYFIEICGGPGSGQIGIISAYNGATKVATLETPWYTWPDTNSLYRLYRCAYKIEVLATTDSLKTVKVTAYYQTGNSVKEISLTTEKLMR